MTDLSTVPHQAALFAQLIVHSRGLIGGVAVQVETLPLMHYSKPDRPPGKHLQSFFGTGL